MQLLLENEESCRDSISILSPHFIVSYIYTQIASFSVATFTVVYIYIGTANSTLVDFTAASGHCAEKLDWLLYI